MYQTLSYTRIDGDYPDPSLIIRWPVIVFENGIEQMYYLEWLEAEKKRLKNAYNNQKNGRDCRT
jgi:malate/lactate dehydrogenase